MTINWEPLREIIESHERFILTSHVRPDADAIGSELGMAALLDRLGKRVRIVNPSGMPKNLEFLDPNRKVFKFNQQAGEAAIEDTDVHLILDTSAWAQLGDLAKVIRRTPAKKVVIDHHASSDDIGAVEFKDTSAEATGTLIVRLADALGWPIPAEAAMPLFAAIATDTGWFRFPSVSSETYRIGARLMELGVEPHRLFQQLYEQRTPARMKLSGRVLGRIQLDADGQLAYAGVTSEDFKETGAVRADTEDLVNEGLKITGTRASFLAIAQPNGVVKVSFRSRSDVNVATVAERFGGGGHKQAAGANIKGPVADVVEMVRAAMVGLFEAHEG